MPYVNIHTFHFIFLIVVIKNDIAECKIHYGLLHRVVNHDGKDFSSKCHVIAQQEREGNTKEIFKTYCKVEKLYRNDLITGNNNYEN